MARSGPEQEPVDHAEASSKFIGATHHLEFHDKRLWDLRGKRDREVACLPEWERLDPTGWEWQEVDAG